MCLNIVVLYVHERIGGIWALILAHSQIVIHLLGSGREHVMRGRIVCPFFGMKATDIIYRLYLYYSSPQKFYRKR